MKTENILANLKRKWFTYLLYILLAILIFSPGAKTWLLKQVVSTGLMKANIKNELGDKENATPVSFSYMDANGQAHSTEDLKGKVVFINFWASWCPPCRAEMPHLDELYQKLKDDKRFVFLFINEDEDQNKAINYLQKNNFSIPLYSRAGNVSTEIFSGTLPTTVVLNKNGAVVLKHSGMAAYNNENFIRQLKDLL